MELILTIDGQKIFTTNKIIVNRSENLIAYKDNKVLNLKLYDKEKQEIRIDVRDIK